MPQSNKTVRKTGLHGVYPDLRYKKKVTPWVWAVRTCPGARVVYDVCCQPIESLAKIPGLPQILLPRPGNPDTLE